VSHRLYGAVPEQTAIGRRRWLATGLAPFVATVTGGAPQLAAATTRRTAEALAPMPPGYVLVGRRMGVPPLLLYGVALQESKMRFGNHALPYPWTLCVRGTPHRFASRADTVSHLRRSVAQGVTNVDCGAMQVNWHWHNHRLGSFAQALDPYFNLQVGAAILLERHAANHGNWFRAIGEYHTGPIATAEQQARAQRYATNVVQRLARVPRVPVAANAAAAGAQG
jgi:soluble lytic murein transglycosylase-like protein